MKKIFIDGKSGTTGLKIYERLANRDDIEVIVIPEEKRRDEKWRKWALNSADIVFLCLPDAAAIEAVSLIENENVVVLDTSTAHRTNSDWAYGFPELSKEAMDKVKSSKRIAVPGCHASGFISLVYPLIESGVMDKSQQLTCFSLTGYSGGGKNMIAQYEADEDEALRAPRQYGITQKHKHLPEMKKITGLEIEPCFCPIVGKFYSGMEVTVPIFKSQLASGVSIEDVKKIYSDKYTGPIVKFNESSDEEGFLSAEKLSGKDSMEISVYGNDDRMILVARYDNLGKGASGAAIECLNIVLGEDHTKSLVL